MSLLETEVLRIIGWIIVCFVAVVMIVFAINNAQPAEIDLWPFTGYALPQFLIVFAGIFTGLFVGGLLAWLSAGRWRRRYREAERDIKMLKFEVADQEKKLEQSREETREAASRSVIPAPASGEVTNAR